MECVILLRLPSGYVSFVAEEHGPDIAVFKNRDEAIALANTHPMMRAGVLYQNRS